MRGCWRVLNLPHLIKSNSIFLSILVWVKNFSATPPPWEKHTHTDIYGWIAKTLSDSFTQGASDLQINKASFQSTSHFFPSLQIDLIYFRLLKISKTFFYDEADQVSNSLMQCICLPGYFISLPKISHFPSSSHTLTISVISFSTSALCHLPTSHNFCHFRVPPCQFLPFPLPTPISISIIPHPYAFFFLGHFSLPFYIYI